MIVMIKISYNSLELFLYLFNEKYLNYFLL